MRTTPFAAPLTAVGLVSAAALAYEILLTRLFAIIHWHDLVATAISLALLGYGCSGTFLAIFGRQLHAHYAASFIGNAFLFGLSSLLCVNLAQQIPFDPLALTWDGWQLVYLAGTFLILAVPFFAAANCIGLSLWHFKQEIPRLYGVDLLGAALGAIVLLGGLALMSPEDVLFGVFLSGLLVAISAALTLNWRPATVALIALMVASAIWVWGRPVLQPAPYKDLARALAVMGADLEYQTSGIAGTLSVVRNEQVPIRVAPGLSLHAQALPPDQLAVFVDGDITGTLHADAGGETPPGYLHYLTSALPYELLEAPRVLIMNAGVGLGIEQALLLGASRVTAVEPNPQLRALACEQHAQSANRRCGPKVDWQSHTPRAYAERKGPPFDLITLGMVGDAAGLNALKSNFDQTREALASFLSRLSPGGMLSIDGPTRLPPRFIPRVINTSKTALNQLGMETPGRHIAVIRGWQHFNLLVSRKPLDESAAARVRSFADARGFDLVWLPGMNAGEANRYQQLSRARYHESAAAILGADGSRPVVDTRFNLAATSDDAPFANRFTRWTEWWQAIYSGNSQQLAQLDTGFFIATATLVVVTGGGILLILLPLFWLGRGSRTRPPKGLRPSTLLYFGLLGIGFLFIEMAWIQRLQLFLGLPLYATTVVLIAFLAFAGLGSLWSQRLTDSRAKHALIAAVVTILLASLVYVFFMPSLLSSFAHLPLAGRGGIVLALLAPLAFAMGIPFPNGLRRLGGSSEQLIPWAWGINGVTSVISAAAAPLLAMEIGFRGLIAIAVAAYLILPAIRLDYRTPA